LLYRLEHASDADWEQQDVEGVHPRQVTTAVSCLHRVASIKQEGGAAVNGSQTLANFDSISSARRSISGPLKAQMEAR
jgi:hypothetical protein